MELGYVQITPPLVCFTDPSKVITLTIENMLRQFTARYDIDWATFRVSIRPDTILTDKHCVEFTANGEERPIEEN